MLYLYLKSIHIIFVICWMAGILYLFRLFMYHALESEAIVKARFEVMERKLYTIITVPGMVVSIICGLFLVHLQPYFFRQTWFLGKFFLVLGLMVITIWANRIRKSLKEGTCGISGKTFRILNEVPTILMIGIVFLVVLKPW